jgi:hypothetical protein
MKKSVLALPTSVKDNVMECKSPNILTYVRDLACSDFVCNGNAYETATNMNVLNGYDTEATISLFTLDSESKVGFKSDKIKGEIFVNAFHEASEHFGKARVTVLVSSCFSGSLPLGRLPYLSQSDQETLDKKDTPLGELWKDLQIGAEEKELKHHLLMITVATDKDSAAQGSFDGTFGTFIKQPTCIDLTFEKWVEKIKSEQLADSPDSSLKQAVKGALHPLGKRSSGLDNPIFRLAAWGDYEMYHTSSLRATIGQICPPNS